MNRKGEVAIAGYYGFGNLGDEAIRVALRQELAERGIDAIWLTACPQARDEIDRRSMFGVYATRSEERRVGKECRSRWSPDH